MDRKKLLERLDMAWSMFIKSYAGLSDEDMVDQVVTGDWSIKDIIVHVTTWENEALKYLPLILAGEKPPRYSVMYGGINAFNARMAKQRRSLPLSDVFNQMNDTHQKLVAFIQNAPEDQIIRETHFRRRLRLDTYAHYRQHAETIRKWRESRPNK
jgi:hypothetical protein